MLDGGQAEACCEGVEGWGWQVSFEGGSVPLPLFHKLSLFFYLDLQRRTSHACALLALFVCANTCTPRAAAVCCHTHIVVIAPHHAGG